MVAMLPLYSPRGIGDYAIMDVGNTLTELLVYQNLFGSGLILIDLARMRRAAARGTGSYQPAHSAERNGHCRLSEKVLL